ncbi:restriction endonuclease [Bradyrhizobium sp. LVM 105]|uniref:restriction endonuclease n=1 Tax=Bradyrhizobium sp. LVM 105 TaxID=2341115 RepID=UPI000F8124F7|nr:restriction endonuclease [Bradyrhizobium sp. LVM 105]RTE92937.1 hypothetical protein D6B98_09800 [Bradyrhizobium sp. LVM 105]
MPVTRTLNPLPFNDLEPRRFEDLVRQLVYDFRPWLRLEATGRAGSDDGFDIRGIELGGAQTEEPDGGNDEDDDIVVANNPVSERTWLIQCKREKAIGPTKLRKYLSEISAEERKGLYGIIFVASADFSKTSRDAMAAWVRENGLSEFQIWSVSDIETMLMQPKNDHILFAFFGISLQVRKRYVASALRARITMKRKIARILSKRMYAPFLLRDPEASDFPYVNEGEELQWMIRTNRGMDFRGVGFEFKEYYAYVGSDGEWDMANKFNRAIPEHDHPWRELEKRRLNAAEREELRKFWTDIPQENSARLTVTAYIPFEDIVAIDDIGDECWGRCRDMPVLFVPIEGGTLNVHPDKEVRLRGFAESDPEQPDSKKRINFFPEKFRAEELG